MEYNVDRPIDALLKDMESTGAVMLASWPAASEHPKWEVTLVIRDDYLPNAIRRQGKITELEFHDEDLETVVREAYRTHYFMTQKGTGLIMENEHD